MAVQFTPHTPIVAFSAAVLAAVAWVGWRRRDHPAWLPLALLAAGGALYAAGYAVELTVTSLALKRLTWRVQVLGWYVLLPSLFVFAVQYADDAAWLTRPVLAAVLAVPAVAVALTVSPFFDLYLADATLVTVGDAVYMDPTYGPWLTVDVFYSYAVVVTSLLVVLRLFASSTTAYRHQIGVVAVGIGVPLAAELLRTLFPETAAAVVHPRVDTIPIGFAVTGVALAWGTYRYDLLDQAPIPTAALIEGTQNGVVVFGSDGRVIQLNGVARQYLDVDTAPARRPLAELSDRAARVARELETGEPPHVIHLGDDGSDCPVIEVRRAPLETADGRVLGELLTLVDVSDRVQYEAELERYNRQVVLLNQMLRHDIRNDAAVAAGWSDLLADDLAGRGDSGELLEQLDRIRTASEHIVELTNVAADVSKAMERGSVEATDVVDLGALLEHEVEKARSTYPDAEIRLADPVPEAPVRASELLGSVFGNLIRNAVVHNDTDRQRVDVEAGCDDGMVSVTVADDGPGIDQTVRERLFEQGAMGERSSGMGLGLYLVRSLVTDFGGEVTVRDNEPRGSVFEVRFPLAES